MIFQATARIHPVGEVSKHIISTAVVPNRRAVVRFDCFTKPSISKVMITTTSTKCARRGSCGVECASRSFANPKPDFRPTRTQEGAPKLHRSASEDMFSLGKDVEIWQGQSKFEQIDRSSWHPPGATQILDINCLKFFHIWKHFNPKGENIWPCWWTFGLFRVQ